MKSFAQFGAIPLLVILFAVGCGAGEIGEACNGVGSTDDCVDGAICTDDGAGVGEGATCRKICMDESDCTASESCRPVSNANVNAKSCQPLAD